MTYWQGYKGNLIKQIVLYSSNLTRLAYASCRVLVCCTLENNENILVHHNHDGSGIESFHQYTIGISQTLLTNVLPTLLACAGSHPILFLTKKSIISFLSLSLLMPPLSFLSGVADLLLAALIKILNAFAPPSACGAGA